jgi:peroxiredoxin
MSKQLQRWEPSGGHGLGTETPAFALSGETGTDGRLHRLREYMGEGVTVVAFVPWQSIRNAKFLAWLNLTDGIDALVVSNGRRSTVECATGASELRVPVFVDPDGAIAREYGVRYEEATDGRLVLVDSTNRVRQTWTGGTDPTEVYLSAQRHLNADGESEFDDWSDYK